MRTKTMDLYQSGLDRDEAIQKGANPAEFDRLVEKYKDGSIPVSDLVGFKATPAYSSDFHTGGKQGEQLREIIRQVNKRPKP